MYYRVCLRAPAGTHFFVKIPFGVEAHTYRDAKFIIGRDYGPKYSIVRAEFCQ